MAGDGEKEYEFFKLGTRLCNAKLEDIPAVARELRAGMTEDTLCKLYVVGIIAMATSPTDSSGADLATRDRAWREALGLTEREALDAMAFFKYFLNRSWSV
jgi:hypothetical protein